MSDENTTVHDPRKKTFMIKNAIMSILCSRRIAIQPMINHGTTISTDARPTPLKTGVPAEKDAMGLSKSCCTQRANEASKRNVLVCTMTERRSTALYKRFMSGSSPVVFFVCLRYTLNSLVPNPARSKKQVALSTKLGTSIFARSDQYEEIKSVPLHAPSLINVLNCC